MLIISEFLPTPLTDNEVGEIVKAAIKKLRQLHCKQDGRGNGPLLNHK